jgi:hypothetical protein
VNRKASAAAFILALLFSAVVVGIRFVNLATANFIPMDGYVESPAGITYSVNKVPLIFRVAVYSYYEKWFNIKTTIVEMFYSLDGKANVTVPMTDSKDEEGNEIYTAEAVLSGLSEGSHKVTVYAKDQNGKVHSYERNFAIDTILPCISVLSVENKTYNTLDVPLNFTINEPFSQIKYSLDGQENVTIAGNTTIAGLSDGAHNITIYAQDIAGNIGASETTYFSVTQETNPQSEPFPTTSVATAIASVVIVAVGLLVYFKKRNH